MSLLRARRAILLVAITTLSLDLAIVGCSSDKPAASGGSTTGLDGSASGGDGSKLDGSGEGDGSSSGDAGGDSQAEEDANNGFVCLDDKSVGADGGAAGDGGGLPVSCSNGSCAAHCDSIHDHYKLGVAQHAIQCISKLANCDSLVLVRNCVDDAISRACKDSTSPGYCMPLVTACDPNAGMPNSTIDEQGCEIFANAFSSAGRTAFSTCLQAKITAGTCPAENGTCADQIRQ